MNREPSLRLPTQGVFTDDPDLQRGVRAFEDRASETVRQTDRRKVDKFERSGRTITSAYTAKLGEMVLYDSTGGGFNICLPKVGKDDAGREVLIKNKGSSANVVLVRGAGNATVDGTVALGLNAALASARLVWDGDTWRLS